MSRIILSPPCPKHSTGFTLIEVVIAVSILAMSLTTLLGLQYSVMQRTLKTESRQAALLMARNIMTALEVAKEVEDQEKLKPAHLLLTEDLGFEYEEGTLGFRDKRIEAYLLIESWEHELGGIPADPLQLRRVNLKLTWGEQADEQLQIWYFLPQKAKS